MVWIMFVIVVALVLHGATRHGVDDTRTGRMIGTVALVLALSAVLAVLTGLGVAVLLPLASWAGWP